MPAARWNAVNSPLNCRTRHARVIFGADTQARTHLGPVNYSRITAPGQAAAAEGW
jgi:hypothetical protein